MKKRKYHSSLSNEDIIFIEYFENEREIIDLKIVYYTEINGITKQVYRIDCSHGFLHKHLLFEPKERIEKIPLDLNKKTMTMLLNEIEDNWQEMKRKFFKKERWKK
ncbi:MAG: hypothetical protein ABH821_03945 [archaeon]